MVGSQAIFRFIDLLKQRGKVVLLSTHRLDEAERVCDRFGLLHRGNLQFEGSLSELRLATGKQHLVDMFIAFMNAPQKQPMPISPPNELSTEA